MLVAMICMDKPNHAEVRAQTRPAHLDWLQNKSGAVLVHAGPILADDGNTPMGSLIIAEFDSLEAARAAAKQDPYALAGLFANVTIQPIRKALPA
jgi:uncharacterized protein YciI